MVWRVRRWTVRSSLRSLKVWSRPRHLDVGKLLVGMVFQLNVGGGVKCVVVVVVVVVMVEVAAEMRGRTDGDEW